MSSRLKYFLVLVLVIGVQQFAAGQSVTAKVDSPAIQIGQQTTLRLFVQVPKNASVAFPNLKDSVAEKVLIVRLDKTDTLIEQGTSVNTIRRNYIITSFDAGSYTIPSIKIKVGNDTVATQPLALQVNTVKVDTTKAFYDIKQPLAVQYTFMDWLRDNWLWGAIALALIAVVAGLFIYFRNRPKDAPQIVEAPKPLVPPHVVATQKLNQLRDKKLWQMDFVKEYHSELTDIVREYIEARYSIPTFEKTTDEILSSLQNSRIDGIDRSRLQQLFTLADLVKFAKERPIAEDNEQSLNVALAFVQSTSKSYTQEGGAGNGVV